MNIIYMILIFAVVFLTISNTGIAAESSREAPKIDKMAPGKLKTATFAMGCFWGPDVIFGGIEGVWKTRVGYAGGKIDNPTYHNLGSHTETIQLEYDPEQITYKELIEIFFDNHNPYRKAYGSQYKSIVFYHNERQKEIFEDYAANLNNGRQLYIELNEYRVFHYAEFYHQKYRLQSFNNIMSELRELYSTDREFINSTLTARLNHYVGSKKGMDLFEKEKEFYGLESETIDWLKNFIRE